MVKPVMTNGVAWPELAPVVGIIVPSPVPFTKLTEMVWVKLPVVAFGLVAAPFTVPKPLTVNDSAPVALKAGWNEVLVKVTQGTGGWGYFFELRAAPGQPMPNVVGFPKKGD